MKSVKFDWKNFVDVGRLKIIRKIGSRMIMLILAPWEIQMIFPARIVRLRVGIVVGHWVSRIHMFRQHLLGMKHMTLFKHVIWIDLVYWFGLTRFTRIDSFVSRVFSLLIRLAILVSTVINDSMKWRSSFEEIWFVFLDFSRINSHWMVFSVRSLNNSHLDYHPFARIPLGTWF